MLQSGTEGQNESRNEIFVRLLAGIQRKLFLYVMVLVPDPQEAEEIVQDVSVVLWRRFEDFRPEEDFFRWACGIARNEVLKHRERLTRSARLFSPEFLEQIANHAVHVVETVDERREALRQCLQELQPHHRELLNQRYFQQMSTEQIAQLRGKSVEAVRRMLHRIRMAVLKCIQHKLRTAEETA
ncbi:MAG: sigma-70 family RNA polymerase sigma factor [Thermogutta sp.]|uniref:sigma-70 family RNA polymerase sigma factor n=1 Tax=Thermogutta sp. TaxID=1962930 RepID=UPI0019B396BE|nr:sigma-70 family RNA polymerase sigma factor [Thermogutta sp.]MBC7354194.1 sigma-70 family RNA polymerase sigma factor [Thermogutta sp.]